MADGRSCSGQVDNDNYDLDKHDDHDHDAVVTTIVSCLPLGQRRPISSTATIAC